VTVGDVGSRILAEHSELRGRLDDIDALVKRAEEGSVLAGEELREAGLSLYALFAAHLDSEDRTLVSELRAGDSAATARAEQLAREHREQRELLRYLVGRLEQQSVPTLLIARELRHFSEYLRQDMKQEDEMIRVEGLLGGD